MNTETAGLTSIANRYAAFSAAIADIRNLAIRAEIGRARDTYSAHARFYDNDTMSAISVSKQWERDALRGLHGYTIGGMKAVLTICELS